MKGFSKGNFKPPNLFIFEGGGGVGYFIVMRIDKKYDIESIVYVIVYVRDRFNKRDIIFVLKKCAFIHLHLLICINSLGKKENVTRILLMLPLSLFISSSLFFSSFLLIFFPFKVDENLSVFV